MNGQNISRSPLNSLKRYQIGALFIFLFLICGGVFGQSDDIVFERINTSHGLSNNGVRKIFQDSKGYLWIITFDGLNKYDGYNFTNYRYDPQDTSSISNNSIWDILEDKSGNLWIATEDGLNLYNGDKENFKKFRYSAAQEQWSNAVTTMFEDDDHNIWFGTVFNGLSIFNPKTEKFKHFLPDSTGLESGISNGVIWIKKDSINKNRFWLGLWQSGFYSFDTGSEKFTKYKHDPQQPHSLSNDNIRSLTQDKEGNVWIGTLGSGLDKFDPDTKVFTHFKHDPKKAESLSNNNVWSIFEDPQEEGTFWIATEGGLNKFDTKSNSFFVYKSDVNDQGTLSSDFVTNIYKDRSGVMWLGTTGGLNKIDPGRVPFRHQSSLAEKPDRLNSNRVYAIIKSQIKEDVLWIGTYDGGLNKYNRT